MLLSIFKLLLYLVGSLQLSFLIIAPASPVGRQIYLRLLFFGLAFYSFAYLTFIQTSSIYIARLVSFSGPLITCSAVLFFIKKDHGSVKYNSVIDYFFFTVGMLILTLLTNVYPNPRLVDNNFVTDVNWASYVYACYILIGALLVTFDYIKQNRTSTIKSLEFSFLAFATIAITFDVVLPIFTNNSGSIFLIAPLSSAIFTGVFFYQIHKAAELEMSQSITRFAFVFFCFISLGALLVLNSTLALVRYAAFLLLILTSTIVYAVLKREQSSHQTLQIDHLATVSYLADIAHRLKTPLAVIDLKAENALNNREDNKRALADIKQISYNTAVTMKNIIQTSKIDYGLAHLELLTQDVSAFILELKPELQSLAKNHLLKFRVASNLWARIDKDRLREVLYNLVDNAAKFSPAKSTISLSLDNKDDKILLIVSDKGQGMDKETKKHLFERHYQSEEGQQHTGSAGLGLAITKWIIEEHGGEIRVQSELNQGSRFIITLPSINSPDLPIKRKTVLKIIRHI